MKEPVFEIAQRIRYLREMAGYSEQETADEVGISLEEYLRYESGQEDISIGFLSKLSALYHVELSNFLTGEDPRLSRYTVVRHGKGVEVERVQGYQYKSLAHNFVGKTVEPFLVSIPPDSPGNINRHPGQEFDFVTEGVLSITLDGQEVILYAGDSIYFDSTIEHALKCRGETTVSFIAVVIPPIPAQV